MINPLVIALGLDEKDLKTFKLIEKYKNKVSRRLKLHQKTLISKADIEATRLMQQEFMRSQPLFDDLIKDSHPYNGVQIVKFSIK